MINFNVVEPLIPALRAGTTALGLHLGLTGPWQWGLRGYCLVRAVSTADWPVFCAAACDCLIDLIKLLKVGVLAAAQAWKAHALPRE